MEEYEGSGDWGVVIDSKFVRIAINIEELWYKVLIGDRICWVYENWMTYT